MSDYFAVFSTKSSFISLLCLHLIMFFILVTARNVSSNLYSNYKVIQYRISFMNRLRTQAHRRFRFSL